MKVEDKKVVSLKYILKLNDNKGQEVDKTDDTKPLVFLLYPLLRVEIVKFSFNNLIKYSIWGVFPVPPTVIFPTLITGMLNSFDERISRSNSLLRINTNNQ